MGHYDEFYINMNDLTAEERKARDIDNAKALVRAENIRWMGLRDALILLDKEKETYHYKGVTHNENTL